jgi:hypothetical protein
VDFDPEAYRAFCAQQRENVDAWPYWKRAAAHAAFCEKLEHTMNLEQEKTRYWNLIAAARLAIGQVSAHVNMARDIRLELDREHYQHDLPWPDALLLHDALSNVAALLPVPPPARHEPRSQYCSAPEGDHTERARCA